MRKPFGEMKTPFLDGFLYVFVSPFYLFTNLIDLWKGKRVWTTDVEPVIPRNTQAEAMMKTAEHIFSRIPKGNKQ